MKTLLLTLILSTGALAQSLPDTLKYIRDTLPVAGTYAQTQGITQHVAPVAFDGCTVRFDQTLEVVDVKFSPALMRVTLPLKSLKDVEVDKNSLSWVMDGNLKVERNNKAIFNLDRYQIKFETAEITAALAKAFLHARDLCRDEKSLF
jgi:hypothetical protein